MSSRATSVRDDATDDVEILVTGRDHHEAPRTNYLVFIPVALMRQGASGRDG